MMENNKIKKLKKFKKIFIVKNELKKKKIYI